ncbi:GIT2 [[Candida] subhashii]|uniref:GIT2 n=1 Tax=[Candida] subhashii TaxID=561895 RepID=A0A8J5QD38_9ASCO|nr:GIT2 [[Candida] subhashii]KAG7661212.1 GIT2 [[Candida] subhashii]
MASRDLPKNFSQLFGWVGHAKKEITIHKKQEQLIEEDFQEDEDIPKVDRVRMKNLWPAFASGAGLFSDGYVNNSISTVVFCLSKIYADEFTQSNAISNIGSIAFVGTVVGQLGFGYISDRIARKGGMMTANVMLIVFTLLCAVATWGTSPFGLFAAITTFRFFLGIAIGAEYPTSSVIASEFANMLPAGKRNRYFAWFTNTMIDLGFVISSFVPLVLLWIFGENHLRVIWRLTIGLGVIPPSSLFFIRLRMKDSTSYQKLHMKKVGYKTFPWWLIVKFYWFRLSIISIIWFIYDFSAYSFGIYSSIIIDKIIPDAPLYQVWGWAVVFNLFYMPGAFLGAMFSDYLGPRLTLALGVGSQGIIGIIMSACLSQLREHVAGFVVVFGIFTTLGEFGPGDNIGLLASKTSATPIRGQYYGIAAAIGKIGAFVGTYVFPVIIRKYVNNPNPDLQLQVPFYISSCLCLFSAALALFFIPPVAQDAINREDADFVEYLSKNGFDVTQLGEHEEISSLDDSIEVVHDKEKHDAIVSVEQKTT